MNIKEKLQLQSTDHPVIYLHREHTKWKAYNESAWYINRQYPEYTPCRDISLDGLTFLYIQLCGHDLDRILDHRSFAKIETDLIAIDSTLAFSEKEYRKWQEAETN